MATKFITIRVEILHDKNLTMSQKIILAEIEQLATLDAGCYASNKHFAEMIGSTKSSVSRTISELEKKGYIDIEIVNGSRNHERIITINRGYQNVKTPLPKCEETKENKQHTANQDLAESEFLSSFNILWKDYTLTFLKGKDRRGGSKTTASKKYLTLREKGYSAGFIYQYADNHALLKMGHKDLERLLRLEDVKQYEEDVINAV